MMHRLNDCPATDEEERFNDSWVRPYKPGRKAALSFYPTGRLSLADSCRGALNGARSTNARGLDLKPDPSFSCRRCSPNAPFYENGTVYRLLGSDTWHPQALDEHPGPFRRA